MVFLCIKNCILTENQFMVQDTPAALQYCDLHQITEAPFGYYTWAYCDFEDI